MFENLIEKRDRILMDAANNACRQLLESVSGMRNIINEPQVLNAYLSKREPITNFTHHQLLAQAFEDISGLDEEGYICLSHQRLGKRKPSIEIQQWSLNPNKNAYGFVINLDSFFYIKNFKR